MDLDLVEKWEMSGLLQGVKNLKPMAEILEEAAVVLINKYGKVEEAQLQKSAALTFPILRRAFGGKDFHFDKSAKSKSRETVVVDLVNHGFVGSVGTYKGNEEEIEVLICEAASEELAKKLSSYENLVVSAVEVKIGKDSFSVSVSL